MSQNVVLTTVSGKPRAVQFGPRGTVIVHRRHQRKLAPIQPRSKRS